ncbi:MAG: phosphoribosylformylglycinamidine synthase [Spartobacteria bacterium]|nr:phosphoribosylformylglycinamidine synthase [Spartobacteria bacterium]
MSYRIEIGLKPGVVDARGKSVVTRAKSFLDLPLQSCVTRDVYKVDVRLSQGQLEQVQASFTDAVISTSEIGRLPAPVFHWMIEVGFKPGVTDNVGRTARALLEDVLSRKLTEKEEVYTSIQYFIKGQELTRENIQHLANDQLANALIQTIAVYNAQEWNSAPVDNTVPAMTSTEKIRVKAYNLSGSDKELLRISRDGILSLSLEEMHAIRAYYARPEVIEQRAKLHLPNQPTDVELECLAQSWSEHCCHKIFSSQIEYTDENGNVEHIDSLFKSYIQRSTREIGEKIDWLVSVFVDNAGVIKFNDHLNVVFKAETHNSPSALDPYGGAITGIVGVNRDPMGTGMGAELLCNTWGYCLGSPFYNGEVPEGLFHPRRIRDGVHQGVIDGGNQSGIPYTRGFERFDDRYIGKPLVYCGTVGLLPKEVTMRPSERKEIRVGDIIVMIGGRIGKDGIHGATFSSEELRKESPAQAVQIGDAFMQRKMYEFILEARDLGMYRCITDNGAGGLSSSVGELAKLSGGAAMDLKQAPLKYDGLQPWEILLSEAQERMTLAVQPQRIDAFLELAARRDVEATVLGKFNDSGKLLLLYGKQTVCMLDMDFLHGGCPRLQLKATWTPPNIPEQKLPRIGWRNGILKKLLSSLNICSREYKSRMYDHEVKGRSVIKPFVGVNSDVPSDATVLFAEYSSHEGIVIADGINPFFSDIDTYNMTLSVVDEAVRRIISTGGRMDHLAALDNFCWPDPVQSEKTPDGEYKLAQLVRANKALYDITTAYQVPLISGKDSMKNDSVRGGRKISIPPTLLISTIGKMDDVGKAVTMPMKDPGDLIFIVGLTHNEMGASAYLRQVAEDRNQPGEYGGAVPGVDFESALMLYRAMNAAVEQGLLKSSHTPTQGGLLVGLALGAIGGDVGAFVDITNVPHTGKVPLDTLLFSESNSRFIITCAPEKSAEVELVFTGLPIAEVGRVTDSKVLQVGDQKGSSVVDISVEKLREAFQKTLKGI